MTILPGRAILDPDAQGGNEKTAGSLEVFIYFDRITHDLAIMDGKPCIRGLRVAVGTILGLLATGQSRERILQAYPYLEPEDIDAALSHAAWRLDEREEPLIIG
ncbi:MAG: DUF433 domain-containing protein [Methylococcales bacterium]